MSHRRADVVAQALRVLDRYGLADLTMRRLAAELGVRPSALYHHFPSKQALLAAVADELLARGRTGPTPSSGAETDWAGSVVATCTALRDAMLAYRDGAEVVSTAIAFGLGGAAPGEALTSALAHAGLTDADLTTATRTLLHYVLGHCFDEQTHLQAGSAGAIDDAPREASDFARGLGFVLDGIRVRVGQPLGR